MIVIVMTLRRPTTIAAPKFPERVPAVPLSQLSAARQERLDDLMARNNNGSLTRAASCFSG